MNNITVFVVHGYKMPKRGTDILHIGDLHVWDSDGGRGGHVVK